MKYRTKDGDVLDLICLRAYDDHIYSVETVLEANRGLADHGPILPAGLVIDLPEAQPATPPTIRLWD